MTVANAFAALVEKIRECGFLLFKPVYHRLLLIVRWGLTR